MFKKALAKDLAEVFGIDKVTFDADLEKEQNVLFIDVFEAPSFPKKGSIKARVRGQIIMFAPSDKLTFGFFAKRINSAKVETTRKFHFSNMDQSGEYYKNLVERKCNFLYFYHAEYDPEAGEINQLTFSFE